MSDKIRYCSKADLLLPSGMLGFLSINFCLVNTSIELNLKYSSILFFLTLLSLIQISMLIYIQASDEIYMCPFLIKKQTLVMVAETFPLFTWNIIYLRNYSARIVLSTHVLWLSNHCELLLSGPLQKYTYNFH